MNELLMPLFDANSLDARIALTAILASIACALPGTLLVLRRQSLLGDALGHALLPGIVLGYLATSLFVDDSPVGSMAAWGPSLRITTMLVGAAIAGILCAVLATIIEKSGRVEPSAALGVVFTGLFAIGLILVRRYADDVDIDASCVLYGHLETVVFETWPGTALPLAAVSALAAIVFNAVLLVAFYKELKLSTFDPEFARAVGIPAGLIDIGLVAATAMTVVATFESVGSILVLAALVVPAVTARLLVNRFFSQIMVSLAFATLAAVGGHLLAMAVPHLVILSSENRPLEVGTAGAISLVSGLMLLATIAFGPANGVVWKAWRLHALRQRVFQEDVLGILYRLAERGVQVDEACLTGQVARSLDRSPVAIQRGVRKLQSAGLVEQTMGIWRLTAVGTQRATEIVRSHRLWETYLARNLGWTDEVSHRVAERFEHHTSGFVRENLADELSHPGRDPQGHEIPPIADAP